MGKALLIIDYQNDFTPPEGALAVEEGDEIAGLINEEAAKDYDVVVATRDWHPPGHSSFAEQGGPWPVHCVQDTRGAELHPDLDRSRIDLVFDKGTRQETTGYSAFETDELAGYLREKGIDEVTVVGLTTDYCVKESALGALEAGFDVEVVPDATRGVDPAESEKALEEVERSRGRIRG